MLILTGCALENNPTGPSLVSEEAVTAASQQLLPKVENINFNGISMATTDNLVITFDKAMNPSTLSVLTVLLYRMADGDNTNEERLTDYSIVAGNDNKTFTIAPTTMWTNDRFYRIKITNTVQSLYGKTLDGNGNGVAEAALDDYNNKFKVGNPSGPDYDFTPITITSLLLEHGVDQVADLKANHAGPISISQPVKIKAIFNLNVDQSTIYTASDALHSNIEFIDSDLNVAIKPNLVEIFDNSITATFNLQADTMYKISFLGGSGGIRSSSATGQPLSHGRYFDNGSNGIPVEGEFDFAYFATQSIVYSSSEMPTVESVTYFGLKGQEGGPDVRGIPDDERRFRIVFNAPGGSRVIDQLTITNDAFIITGTYPAGSGETFLINPSRIDCVCSDGYNVADIYLPDSIYPNTNNAVITVQMTIRAVIATTDGRILDNNGDGAGGFINDRFHDEVRTIYAEKQTGGVF